MRWDWDFLRNRRTEIDNRFRQERPAEKVITVNGHVHEIQGADVSDMEVAGRIRMLMRGQLDHESVCTLARDRIVYLADRLGEIEALTAEDFGRAIWTAAAGRLRPGYKVDGADPIRWDQLPADDRIRQYHVELGSAVLALLAAPPAPADTRVWHDRTTLASKFEEQRTRDGYHRHRLKGTETWTEGRPQREGQTS